MKHFAIHKLSKTQPSLLTKVSDKLCCGDMDSAVYFYHSDHLGSASWITNGSGTPVQHLQYMPYGEPFVNERTTGYEERFTFTGKERDSETGFSYFGARYYDSDILTGWLSVDPMADKYPSLSPYAYCGWNPVRLVDPDGRDWYIAEGQNTPTYDKNITSNNCPEGASYIGKTAHWFGQTENDLQYYYHGNADGSITQQDMTARVYDSFLDYDFEINYDISNMICDYYGETSKKWLNTPNKDKHKILYTLSKNGLLGDAKPGNTKKNWDKFAKNNYKKIGYAGTVFSGIDIATSLMEDGWTPGVNTAGSLGSAAVGWAGAKAGASLGAIIGVPFWGVGSAVEAGIGAIIGGVGGGILGNYVGKEAYKLF